MIVTDQTPERQVADVLFDLLIETEVKSTSWANLLQWIMDCENGDEDLVSVLENAFQFDFEPGDTQVTRAAIEHAYASMGYSFQEEFAAYELEHALKNWEDNAKTYRGAIEHCGNAPHFSVAKENYEKLLAEAEAAIEACRRGELVRVDMINR